ncbi:hypothetical protein F5144DRAFT_621445 [Chaetomium tenue]|uniref:Uncharacterized protein n=1 Tax=Chaetomium tenue TaxID=1854479 RepID=A0ACB7PD52_9PEZI|nr:hypothetical protein F5144DRAFT_621445 [Chaetomium globosum]
MVQQSENGKATGDKLRDAQCFHHLSQAISPWSLNEDGEPSWSPSRVHTSILLVNYREDLLRPSQKNPAKPWEVPAVGTAVKQRDRSFNSPLWLECRSPQFSRPRVYDLRYWIRGRAFACLVGTSIPEKCGRQHGLGRDKEFHSAPKAPPYILRAEIQ